MPLVPLPTIELSETFFIDASVSALPGCLVFGVSALTELEMNRTAHTWMILSIQAKSQPARVRADFGQQHVGKEISGSQPKFVKKMAKARPDDRYVGTKEQGHLGTSTSDESFAK